MEVSGQFHAPATVSQGNQLSVPTECGLCWPHRRSRRYGEEENLLHLPGYQAEPLGRPARAPFTIPSELFRLPGKRELSNSKSFLQIIAVYCSRRFCAIFTSNCSQKTTVQAENSILYTLNFIQQKYRLCLYIYTHTRTQDVPEEKVNILRGHSIGHSKQKLYMYMCPIPNGVRDRAISPYSTLYRRATRHVLTRVAKCIVFDSGIFENVLSRVGGTRDENNGF
jgi:hypothetical protein